MSIEARDHKIKNAANQLDNVTGGAWFYEGLNKAYEWVDRADKYISKKDYFVSGKQNGEQLADLLWNLKKETNGIITEADNLKKQMQTKADELYKERIY